MNANMAALLYYQTQQVKEMSSVVGGRWGTFILTGPKVKMRLIHNYDNKERIILKLWLK